MYPNRLKAKAQAGQSAYGTICTQGSVDSVEIAAHAGFDFVFVDGQHGTFTADAMRAAAAAIQTTTASPVVRVSASHDAGQIEYLLDSGYTTLVCPMVNTAQCAQALVDAAYYSPLGHRSTGSCRAAVHFGGDYYARINDELLLLVQIEHVDGVKNVDQIMATQGVGGCLVGPGDLSVSLGMSVAELGGDESAELDRALRTICDATRDVGKIPGIFASSPRQAHRRVEQGYRLVAVGYEFGVLGHAWRETAAQLNA